MARNCGPRYKNGNCKDQQKKYNKGKKMDGSPSKGPELIRNAQKLRRKLKIPKGSPYDASHFKGSETEGRAQHYSINRKSRLKTIRRKKRGK